MYPYYIMKKLGKTSTAPIETKFGTELAAKNSFSRLDKATECNRTTLASVIRVIIKAVLKFTRINRIFGVEARINGILKK